jgi:hypothetical protein
MCLFRPLAIFLMLIFGLLFLGGCVAGETPIAMPTESPAASPLPRSTLTPVPTETAWPSRTPTTSPSPLPSSTPTPTLHPDYSAVELIGLGWSQDYDMMLSFRFPGQVDAEQVQVKMEDKMYRCEVLPQYPDRLYCFGQGAKVVSMAWIRVFPTGSRDALYEKQVWIPFFDNDYNNSFNKEYGAVFDPYKPTDR